MRRESQITEAHVGHPRHRRGRSDRGRERRARALDGRHGDQPLPRDDEGRGQEGRRGLREGDRGEIGFRIPRSRHRRIGPLRPGRRDRVVRGLHDARRPLVQLGERLRLRRPRGVPAARPAEGPVQVDNKANTTAGWWVNRAGNLYVANFGGTPLGSATVSFTACWAAWDN